jgi:hypothetical protein
MLEIVNFRIAVAQNSQNGHRSRNNHPKNDTSKTTTAKYIPIIQTFLREKVLFNLTSQRKAYSDPILIWQHDNEHVHPFYRDSTQNDRLFVIRNKKRIHPIRMDTRSEVGSIA